MRDKSCAQKPHFAQKKDPIIEEESASGYRMGNKQVKALRCMAFKNNQSFFHKKLDNIWGSKYINKAPEEKRFTQRRAEPRKKNSLKA